MIRYIFIAVLLMGAANVSADEGPKKNVDISAENISHAPVFTSKAVTEATEDRDYTYLITTADTDADDSRAIIAPKLPVWLRLINNGDGTALLTGIPGNEDVGSHWVILQVQDAEGGKDIQSFAVSVENTNDAPVFVSQPATEASENQIYQYAVITTDPDSGDIRTVKGVAVPEWLNFEDKGDGAAILSGIPKARDVGDHSVVLESEDAARSKAIQSFTITVRKLNEMNLFSRMLVPEASENKFYTSTIAVKSNRTESPRKITAEKLPRWLTFEDKGNGTAVLSGTPSDSDAGICKFKLTVSSGEHTEGSQNIAIAVATVNDAPVLDSSGDMFLNTIPEDIPDGRNIGTMIAAMLISGGKIDPVTDKDAGAKEGIALISADKSAGVWQYDEDRNGIFTDFPEDIAEDKAVLLNDDAVIRLVPAPDFTGSSEIAFRAWDRTQGCNGDTGANTVSNGGTTAFSKDIEKAVIIVRPVFDIPYFDSTQLVELIIDN